MNIEEIEELHKDPSNWHLFVFYFCPKDPRIVVKKKLGITGWTLNFANPLAVPFLILTIGLIFGIQWCAEKYLSIGYPGGILIAIVTIIALCLWLSNPKIYQNKNR